MQNIILTITFFKFFKVSKVKLFMHEIKTAAICHTERQGKIKKTANETVPTISTAMVFIRPIIIKYESA